ncbi:hypothetical protein D3C85_1083730 [compost metagenome]
MEVEMSSRLVYPLPSSHTSSRQPCTVRLVSQSEAMGVPLRFWRRKMAGKAPWRAALKGTSAENRVQLT